MASEDQDKDQKTYAPTEKRIEDARKKGDVPMAPEMRQAAMFLGLIVATGSLGAYSASKLAASMARIWGRADSFLFEPQGAQAFGGFMLGEVASGLLPLLGALFGFALLGGLMQGRPMMNWSRLQPKWSKINPISGFGRLFGMRAFVEFGKTLAKLAAVAGIGSLILWPFLPGFETMVGIGPGTIADLAHGMVADVLLVVIGLIIAIAVFDFFYQRHSWTKKKMMSLQDIKDEHKQQEGDPKIKARIRQIGMQRSRKRMMAAVPTATVVITNPTHYAVALRYDHGDMSAPIVVAKGTDAIALKIREIATANGVPLVENRPLARALHASAEVDRPIPVEHYQAVAEVISYVLKLARGGT
ncbi:flagellar biosynthesis protein FlhB [Sphingomonas sp. ST-64]|uniref:Flagellar biosynthetic protein FlhB n=1 Tax=Sphingomonas plantiphila TaxID=3163295 RepID=A0ABW8YNF3_9SPHN